MRGPGRWFRSGREGWNAGAYEWYFTRTPLGRALRRRDTELIFGALEEVITPTDDVLEVGAGTGNYAIPMARRCARVVALEPSPAMLAHLRRRLAEDGGGRVEARPGHLPDGLPASQRFQGVVCLGVLNYVADLDGALRALSAQMAPGGWLVFSVPPRSLEGGVHVLADMLQRRRVFLRRRGEAAEAARRAGLEVERVGTAGVTRGGITTVVSARAAR